MPPLGFRFAPRIRDLADKRLYICGNPHLQTDMESLKPLHQM
jgi:TnpA family transposase